MKIFSGKDAANTLLLHIKLIKNESDRGAVLVAASLLETSLEHNIKLRLVPSTSKKDFLLDGGQAPIGTFSSKIELAYRLGIICYQTKDTLNVFRKLRNEFAHNHKIFSLEEASIKDRVEASFQKHPLLYKGLRQEFDTVIMQYIDIQEIDDFYKTKWPIRQTFNFFFSYLSMALSQTHLQQKQLIAYEISE